MNNIEVNALLAKNALAVMHNKLAFLKLVDRQLDSQWANNTNGYAQGDSYQINRPARFKSVDGNVIGAFNASTGMFDTGAFVEDPVTFSVSTVDQKNISTSFNSKEKTLALRDEKSRLGEPVGAQLATDIEKKVVSETIVKGGGYILAEGNATLGTKIAVQDLLKAQARLDSLATPTEARSTLIPPSAMAELSRENLNLFTPTMNEDVAVKGYIKEFAGSEMYSYNLLPTLTVPAISTALEVAVDVAEGAESVTVLVAAGDNGKVLKAGTILEFDSYDVVNPETRDSAGYKYSFAVKADVTLATGNTVIAIDAAAKIYSAADVGNRQNITGLPVDGDAITVVGAGKSFYMVTMFQEDAYTATVIPLTTDLPGADSARADWEGFSVRTAVQTVVGSDTVIHRFDCMGKGILQRDSYAVRVLVEI